jgi:eukaryotic-like serine/threonine-protein kinase
MPVMPNIQAPIVTKRYVLQELLGRGGMGAVYRALDRLTGREIALKRVTTDKDLLHLSDSNEIQDFRLALAREFKLSASLRHPNIVQVLDYGFDDEHQPFFTMELLQTPKTVLDASINQTLDTKISFIVQILYALTYLHRRGIVHHDLKPANVLVVNGQVKVLDFGLSVMHERTSHESDHVTEGSTAGTLAYMPPEVLMGEQGTIPSDLYAVGMMAYEMIAGKHPFDVDTPTKLIHQIINVTPDSEELDITKDLAVIITRLLDKDVQSRYQSATEVIEAINRVIAKPYPIESAAIRESFLQAARLVGREAEIAQLIDALNRMTTGHGSAWLVAGESGVGKSRIVDELRTVAMVRGAVVMRGQAVNVGSRPFELWLPILRWMCLLEQELTDDDIGLLKNFIPDIEILIGRNVDHIEAQQLRPEVLQERLLILIEEVVSRQNKPVVILLDDLHWIGSESLKTLENMSEWVATLPILIIGTYRDEERPELAQELPKMPVMKLKRLDDAGIAELSAAMLGETGRSPQVVDLLRRESEGNVFFVIEVVRVLAEEVGKLENIGRTTLPPKVFAGGIKTVIQRRLNQLDDQSRYLLNAAAVMGRQMDLRVLRRIAPDTNQQAWLANCANAAVLEVEEDRWRFTHDKLREALIDGLVPLERQIIHARIASAMEYYYADNSAYAMALAYHWGNGNDKAKEERYVTLAGEQALKTGGYHEAIHAFRRAETLVVQLELPQERTLRKLVNLRQLMGAALLGVGNYEAARSHYRDSLQLMQDLKDRRGIAVSLGHLGSVAFALADFEDARSNYNQALKIYREVEDTLGVQQTLNHLGDVLYEIGDHDTAKKYYQESLDLARERGADWAMAGAVRQTQVVQSLSLSDTEHMQAKTMFLQVLEVHRKTNNQRGIADILYNLGVNAQNHDDLGEAIKYFQESLGVRQTIQDEMGITQIYERLAKIAQQQNQPELAWQHFQNALKASQQVGIASMSLMVLVGMANWLVDQENGAKALEILGYVLHDPATPEQTLDTAENLIFDLEEILPSNQIESGWEASKRHNLASLINTLL